MLQCKKLIRAAATTTKATCSRPGPNTSWCVERKGQYRPKINWKKNGLLFRPRLEPMVVTLLRIPPNPNPNTLTAFPKGVRIEVGKGPSPNKWCSGRTKPQDAPDSSARWIASASTTLKKWDKWESLYHVSPYLKFARWSIKRPKLLGRIWRWISGD